MQLSGGEIRPFREVVGVGTLSRAQNDDTSYAGEWHFTGE